MWGSDVNNGNIFLEETCLVFLAFKNENSRYQHTLCISTYVRNSVYMCRNALRLKY